MKDFLDKQRRAAIFNTRSKIISTIGRFSVKHDHIMQLENNKPVTCDMMNICFELLRCREQYIESSPLAVNNATYKKSVFANVWYHDLNQPESINQLHQLFNLGSFDDVHYIYIPYYQNEIWSLLVLHPVKKNDILY